MSRVIMTAIALSALLLPTAAVVQASELVHKLAKGDWKVIAPYDSLEEFKAAIDRDYVHIKFMETRGADTASGTDYDVLSWHSMLPIAPSLASATHAGHQAYAAALISAPFWVMGGALLGWRWASSRAVRTAHACAVTLTVAEFLFDLPCPLTLLENWLLGAPMDAPFVTIALPPTTLALTVVAYLSFSIIAHCAALRLAPEAKPRGVPA